jgi:hypothetical protein
LDDECFEDDLCEWELPLEEPLWAFLEEFDEGIVVVVEW